MPKLEEINDIDDVDNFHMDLAELDPSLRTPIAPKITPTVVRSQDVDERPLYPNMAHSEQQGPSFTFINPDTGKVEDSARITNEDMDGLKKFQILYPCYFDKNRTHKQGRKVPVELAVENPLAKTIADACRYLGMVCVFEGEKTHPQDFGNPGRVRVLLKEDKKPISFSYTTKRFLMRRVSEYLQAHPTTLESLKEVPYGPEFDGIKLRRIPMVKGFQMNDIVPLHSSFTMEHPMTKGIYEVPKPAPSDKQYKTPKNKYKVVRR
ncbi:RNA-binding signal recognition particle subunit SEC65 Ecym_2704 [Eremothecium cymbalariae DBVPG|uniref:Signal recognition particle SEC65 subunit n=1 Tax=Eremothecium cymbalariae (strain CBS 270.75 / DBVPG 7215 / KCTC 17166 / NRRL Y-17582) TaxID=931890 RepID=G8JPE4_ERECY|nr:Hypothetical protein Ecym_2704 [Eremothecium cymbalariae DBVPG\